LLSLVVASSAWGKNGVVTTLDGQTFEGDVTVSGQSVTIMTKSKGLVKLNRANVKDIKDVASNKEQFEKRMAALDKNDSNGRVDVARWAVDHGEFDLALDALDSAIAVNPNNEDAISMRRTVLKERELDRKKKTATATPPGVKPKTGAATPTPPERETPAPAPAAKEDAGPGKPIRLVTAEEINRIRQLEMQKNDNVRVILNNDVKRRYMNSAEGITLAEFNKMTPLGQAMEILHNGGSKLAKDVTIATDPQTMARFKSDVQRNILPGCATASCHGTPGKGGDFTLHSPANKEAETYTNFLLMQNYKKATDKNELALIDRQKPENSLLLLYGLPPKDAPVAHPEVQNFRPMYKGKNDPKYKLILDWIGHSLAPIAPEYGIDLSKEPEEGDGATTRPSGRGGRTDAGGDTPRVRSTR
jgi:hypothetical protein